VQWGSVAMGGAGGGGGGGVISFSACGMVKPWTLVSVLFRCFWTSVLSFFFLPQVITRCESFAKEFAPSPDPAAFLPTRTTSPGLVTKVLTSDRGSVPFPLPCFTLPVELTPSRYSRIQGIFLFEERLSSCSVRRVLAACSRMFPVCFSLPPAELCLSFFGLSFFSF